MLIIQLCVEDKQTLGHSLEGDAVKGHTLRFSTLLSTSYALFTCEHAVSACLLGFHSNDACAPGETARSPFPSLPQTHSGEAYLGVSQVLYVCTPCGLPVTSATLPKCDDRSTSTYCLLGMRSSLALALRTDSTPWIQ